MHKAYESAAGPGGGLPKAVRALLIVSIVVFAAQLVVDQEASHQLSKLFGLSRGSFAPWQPVTYIFLHGSVWHIFINMLVLVMFGRQMEQVFGTRRFVALFFASGVLAGVGWLAVSGRHAGVCIGASGAVFGVMGSFAGMFPNRVITLLLFFVLPVSMRARTLAILLAAVALASLIMGGGTVAHAAHLGGGLVGYVYGMRMARGAYSRQATWESAGQAPGAWRPVADLKARWRRSRFRLVRDDGDVEVPSAAEVDRVLDKVIEQGLDSLTRGERDILNRASRGEDDAVN